MAKNILDMPDLPLSTILCNRELSNKDRANAAQVCTRFHQLVEYQHILVTEWFGEGLQHVAAILDRALVGGRCKSLCILAAGVYKEHDDLNVQYMLTSTNLGRLEYLHMNFGSVPTTEFMRAMLARLPRLKRFTIHQADYADIDDWPVDPRISIFHMNISDSKPRFEAQCRFAGAHPPSFLELRVRHQDSIAHLDALTPTDVVDAAVSREFDAAITERLAVTLTALATKELYFGNMNANPGLVITYQENNNLDVALAIARRFRAPKLTVHKQDGMFAAIETRLTELGGDATLDLTLSWRDPDQPRMQPLQETDVHALERMLANGRLVLHRESSRASSQPTNFRYGCAPPLGENPNGRRPPDFFDFI